MAHRVDRLDRAIVELLQSDGRMSSAEIARRIGSITERAVRYRVERLIEQGVITINAVVSPKALGFQVVGDISLEVEPSRVNEVARQLADYECVSYVACSMGQRDVSIQVNARSNDELYRFATEVLGNLPGVKKTSTLIVPVKFKDVYQWRIPPSSCVDEQDHDN